MGHAKPNKANDLTRARAKTLTYGCIDSKTYEVDDRFRAGQITPEGVHTTTELVALLERDASVGFEAIVWGVDKHGKRRPARMNRDQFLEHWKKNNRSPGRAKQRIKESWFDGAGHDWPAAGNTVGADFVPLTGGPFNKQLYLHDMLRMVALAFFAYHHDPIARAFIHLTRDFTLGRGFRVDCKDDKALALWRAFEEANKLQEYMNFVAIEIATYGEVFVWWLPDGEKFIAYQDAPGQEPPKGIIPRIRLMDPSTVWEIITYPEDITRVLAYQQVFATQFQMYSGKDGGSVVPSSKFIIQQVPAEQVDHHAINRVSNEKRGRSDLYPAFGYLKRLRDTVEYSIVALQKSAAWAIDTEISGSQADIDAYVQDQESRGTIAPAGSEFVHTPKIKRQYMANQATSMSAGNVSAFEWCVNMACAAVQIPVSYLGFHQQGGSTRASAIVGTEPVAKKFEMRQLVYKRVLQAMWDRVMKANGIEAQCEITFPEIIAQDASAKIKNLVLANEVEVISHETMATGIAQELGITNYNYEEEQKRVDAENAADPEFRDYVINPLTKPGATAKPDAGAAPGDAQKKPSAVTKSDKRGIDLSRGM